ncbi:MAG: LapA family protein [Armatimonadota bacterium]|nr:LapA family protein [Armatimonadota bacterium]MCX7776594.1 LapA family protein [Armatimonadota bacterium]MDW8025263.1 LapA family protein [Armatimonadota bacterium]
MAQQREHEELAKQPSAKGITVQDVKRWALIALLVLCCVIVLSFIVANWQSVDVTLLPFTQPVETPLCVALIIAFASGWLIGTLTMLLRQRRHSTMR